MHFSNRMRISAASFLLAALMAFLVFPVTGQNTTGGPAQPQASPQVFLIIPGETRTATLYASGKQVQTEWETVLRPMCFSRPDGLTQDDLLQIAQTHKLALNQAGFIVDGENGNGGDGVDTTDGGIAGGGFTIIFNLDSSVPPAAVAAFDDVKAYLESIFADQITITVNVDFQSLAPGVLGATGSLYTHATWPASRAGLQAGMDSNDNIQNYLPSGSTIPVRYNGNSPTITNENRVFWTRANFRATIGSVSGHAADITFNSNFSWDYDPSDGVIGYSLQDVLIHEMGHVMGFSSGVDYRTNDMEALDIFRFQRTGGGHDYNPDTLQEFKTRPRLVSFNKPNDEVIVDVINKEYRMSDGDPYQSSHFRLQSDYIGLMSPAIGSGETHYPNFYSPADLRMLDAIGYDR